MEIYQEVTATNISNNIVNMIDFPRHRVGHNIKNKDLKFVFNLLENKSPGFKNEFNLSELEKMSFLVDSFSFDEGVNFILKAGELVATNGCVFHEQWAYALVRIIGEIIDGA